MAGETAHCGAPEPGKVPTHPPYVGDRGPGERAGGELVGRGDDALDPGGGVGDLGAGGEVLGPRPHLVEAVHADPLDGTAHEALPVAVLPQLRVDAEQPAHDLLAPRG